MPSCFSLSPISVHSLFLSDRLDSRFHSLHFYHQPLAGHFYLFNNNNSTYIVKMYTKTLLLSALVAFTEARFSQEGLVQNAIQGLSAFGNPGEAPTLAGQTPGVLLAGANACAKVHAPSPLPHLLSTKLI
jgi:hypothetical protein